MNAATIQQQQRRTKHQERTSKTGGGMQPLESCCDPPCRCCVALRQSTGTTLPNPSVSCPFSDHRLSSSLPVEITNSIIHHTVASPLLDSII